MMQWNVSYQRQLGREWLATANYLGNKTTHIWGSYDLNPSLYIPGSSAATNNRRIYYLENPAQGQYYSSIQQTDDGGNAEYNALLLSIQHRFSNHYLFVTNYTFSHCISEVDFLGELGNEIYQNPNNRNAERSSCGFDHRQNFNTSLVVTSPAVGNAFVKRLTGNWQISPLITFLSGEPLTPTDGGKDISLSGELFDRPNVALPGQVYPASKTPLEWFNPAAFVTQPTGTFGNAGRLSLVGPGTISWDMGASRSFAIRERWKLQYRAEFFNIMNHANWSNPTVSNSSGQFGQITTFGSPRIIQMALKLYF
jgi:hypothetical protein